MLNLCDQLISLNSKPVTGPYISDGLFGLLFCIAALLHSIIHLIGQCGQIILKLLLLVYQASVLEQQSLGLLLFCDFILIQFDEIWVTCYLRVQQVDPLSGLEQLMLSQLACSVILLQQSPELLHLRGEQIVSALCHSHLFLQLLVLVNILVQL